jgi:hypothetical protein
MTIRLLVPSFSENRFYTFPARSSHTTGAATDWSLFRLQRRTA